MQLVIVILIGVFVFSYIGYKVYTLLTRKPSDGPTCGCGSPNCGKPKKKISE